MTSKILIVDDERDIVGLLKYNLEKEGYKCYVAYNGTMAISVATEVSPDLILLDIMMPEIDGIEACRQMRKQDNLSDTIIAFLTARGEEYSEIAGFEAGADDYITKPIKPRVLLSRVKALLGRKKQTTSNVKMVLGNIVIDRNSFDISISGEKMILPKKEFELLYLLASKPDKVFTRDTILARVWGEVSVVDRTIDVHIRKIREKIGDNRIQTVKGVGYKFVL